MWTCSAASVLRVSQLVSTMIVGWTICPSVTSASRQSPPGQLSWLWWQQVEQWSPSSSWGCCWALHWVFCTECWPGSGDWRGRGSCTDTWSWRTGRAETVHCWRLGLPEAPVEPHTWDQVEQSWTRLHCWGELDCWVEPLSWARWRGCLCWILHAGSSAPSRRCLYQSLKLYSLKKCCHQKIFFSVSVFHLITIHCKFNGRETFYFSHEYLQDKGIQTEQFYPQNTDLLRFL